jgi:hypothetical protein
MSVKIERLINELAEAGMVEIKKLKKAELQSVAKDMLRDNLREMTDDTIVAFYEETFNTNLAGYW